MASYLAGFDALDAVSQLLLADICLSRGRCYGASFIKALIAARHQAGLERAPYQFLKGLELAVRPVDQPAPKAYDTDSVALEYAVQLDYSTSGWLVVTQAVSCSGQHRSVVRQELLRPIYSCLQIRGHGYPLWKLRNDPSATKGATQMILLAYLIFQLQLRVPDFNLSHMTVLELLLETGLLDITTTLGLIKFSHSQFTLAPTSTGRLSVWQHFLVGGCVFRSLYARFIVAPKFVLRRNAAFCDTVILFLKHGAPQNFSAKGDSKTITFWFGGGRGGDGRTKSFTLLFQGQGRKPRDPNIYLHRRRDYPSLSTWIEDLDLKPKRKKEILLFLYKNQQSRLFSFVAGKISVQVIFWIQLTVYLPCSVGDSHFTGGRDLAALTHSRH